MNKTWIIDIDGTIFYHNLYKTSEDIILPGAYDFFQEIDKNDKIILVTARSSLYKEQTERALIKYGIKYDNLIFDCPTGQRILINDVKPFMPNLNMAIGINVIRDKSNLCSIFANEKLERYIC